MLIEELKSKLITPADDLFKALLDSLRSRNLREKSVVVITSKVVAVTEGRVEKITGRRDFERLVEREADKVYGLKKGSKVSAKDAAKASATSVTLTLKNNIFTPWAGIDRSNIKKGRAVLWPAEPFKTAREIRARLIEHYKIKKLGVIVSDSFCVPLRKGVSAVALGYAGIKGVRDLKGKKDLYGNKLRVSRQGVADMLAASAHLVMGESYEQTPFALITGAPVDFTSVPVKPDEPLMEPRECLFAPLYCATERNGRELS